MHSDAAEPGERESTVESGTDEDSGGLLATLGRPAAREQVERAGELFLIATVGFAISGASAAALPGTAVGVDGVTLRASLEAAVLAAPVLGLFTGVLTALEYEGDAGEVLAVAAAGAGLGGVVCAGTAYFVAFSTFGTGVALSFGSLAGVAVGTAITGGLAGLVTADARMHRTSSATC